MTEPDTSAEQDGVRVHDAGPLAAAVALDAVHTAGLTADAETVRLSPNTIRVGTPTGAVVVKAQPEGEGRATRIAWQVNATALLGRRGCPVPETVWWGRQSRRWIWITQEVPGRPVIPARHACLQAVGELLRLQRHAPASLVDAFSGIPGEWERGVVTHGWAGWLDHAVTVAPELVDRLRRSVGQPEDFSDLVRFDANPGNWLTSDGLEISGVVDFDHLGVGTAAVDVADVALGWLTAVEPTDPAMVRRVLSPVVTTMEDAWPLALTYNLLARLSHHPERRFDQICAAADRISRW